MKRRRRICDSLGVPISRLAAVVLIAGVSRAAGKPRTGTVDQCAEYYLAHQGFDRGMSTSRQFLQRSPTAPRALKMVGVALASARRLESQNRKFEHSLKLSPRSDLSLSNLAVSKFHLKGEAGTKNDFKPALKYPPSDPPPNLFLVERYLGEKQFAMALRPYDQAGTRSRGNPRAILREARAALKEGNQKKAVSILALLGPADGSSHFAAGAMLAEAKAYAAAAREFGLARQTYQDPYAAGYNQTLAYVNAGNYSAAIGTANELLNQGHQTAELASVAATAYLKNGQPREAYNALRLATHLDPKNEDGYVDLCEISLDYDNYDLGLEIADLGLSHLPNSERLYLQRGVMRAMKGQFPDAEKDFAKASELAPNEVLPDISLGLLAMQTGRLEKAVEILRRGATRHPDNYLAQYWFAQVLLHSGAPPRTRDGDEVLAALRTSVRLNPDFWHARAELGKVLLERDEVDSAITQLEKAAALNPSASSPLYLLARAYRRKGDDARARDLVTRVSKMQTEERDALSRATLKHIVRDGTAGGPPELRRP